MDTRIGGSLLVCFVPLAVIAWALSRAILVRVACYGFDTGRGELPVVARARVLALSIGIGVLTTDESCCSPRS
jgi:hypothetical protein